MALLISTQSLRRFFLLGVAIVLGWLSLAGKSSAQTRQKRSEAEVKSAYLYHFTVFTEWPQTAFEKEKSSFIICILGEDPFGAVLDKTLSAERGKGRDVEVVRVGAGGEIPKCHILYIGNSERDRLLEILRSVADHPILTVSDLAPFCRLGGGVRFHRDERGIGLVINPRAVRRAGLKLDPELLSMAKLQNTNE